MNFGGLSNNGYSNVFKLAARNILLFVALLFQAKDLETTLKNVPAATDIHVAALDKLITSVSEEMKAMPEIISTRSKLVSQLNDLLVAKVKGMLCLHLSMIFFHLLFANALYDKYMCVYM